MPAEVMRMEALRFVLEYQRRLEQLAVLQRDEFTADFRNGHAAERLLLLMANLAAQLNTEITTAVEQTTATDCYGSFLALRNAGWLSANVAERLGHLPIQLVHRYEGIRPDQVYDRVQALLPSGGSIPGRCRSG